MSKKFRISAVSYTNSKPFVHGLQQSDLIKAIDFTLDIPSDCADKLIKNQVDIGLVPVATLLSLPSYHIISDYCIGAHGAVHSVFIFSEKPIQEISTIKVDSQSRTSNLLAKVLLKNHWQMAPEWVTSGEADAFVLIGDRTFGKVNDYAFAYDLAEEWFKMTGLPFVFAAWVANKLIPTEIVAEFNAALKLGLDHREEIIPQLDRFENFDMERYLMDYIDYELDEDKKRALGLFLELAKSL